MNVVIAAAGTGGHINPGIAIANKIKEMDKDSNIIFIGTDRGLENDLVPRSGFELKTINAYGIERKINLKNLKKLSYTVNSIKDAEKILKDFKADVVVGTGGYICMPVIIAASKLKITSFLHESNAFPGVAVKLLSRKANAVLVGFEDAKKRLPGARKVVVVGNPTKIKKLKLSNIQKSNIIKEIGLNENKPIVLAFGGSQGAKSINESLINIIKEKMNKDYQIMWAVGKDQYEGVKEKLKLYNLDIEKIENVKIVPYIYNMEEVLNVCDLVVSRSGAMTITEIAIVGKPAIFIPFPYATENHQEYNARVLESRGAAKIILDKDLNENILNKQIEEIVLDKKLLDSMMEKSGDVAITDAVDRIYEEIKK